MKQSLRIKQFDPSIPLPEYKTPGAAAFDLSARLEIEIPGRSVAYVPLNVAMEPPTGFWILLVPRSSLHKLGLVQMNGVGIGDADFCGDEDEYKAALYNITDKPVVINKGQRIMQAVVMPLTQVDFIAETSLANPSRGGFGSTGHN